MNINFHYAAIKALAEHAGFSARESQLIAYASQFVDDATRHEILNLDKDPNVPGVRFERGEFDPICTAHKDIDYVTNLTKPRAHLLVYACFHFIPSLKGARGRPAFRRVERGGDLAKKLVSDAVLSLSGSSGQDRMRKLIALGIALHSYADTWSHQGFSGFRDSSNNDISHLRVKTDSGQWKDVDVLSALVSYAAPDLGHAETVTLPDRSELAWDCIPAKTTSKRDNCREFLKAAKAILSLLSKATGTGKPWSGIKKKLEFCLRHPACDMKAGRDSPWTRRFGKTRFVYDENEWFKAALSTKGDLLDLLENRYRLDPLDLEVLKDKRYFYFHAAALAQRRAVLNAI